MRLLAIGLLSCGLLSATGCGGDSTLTIHNDSSFDIYEVYLAPIDSIEWGPDLLGGNVLDSGETLEIVDIDCDTYDIMLVDEDGDDCILEDVDLCLDDAVWQLDDISLAICTLF